VSILYEAAKANKHIFIEKLIALSLEVGRDMVKAAKETEVITQVGFHMRWGAAVRELVKLIKMRETERLYYSTGSINAIHYIHVGGLI
jgi:predicted dehydrogenase